MRRPDLTALNGALSPIPRTLGSARPGSRRRPVTRRAGDQESTEPVFSGWAILSWLWLVAISVSLSVPALAAEVPEIAVELGENEIFAGESVDYLVEIRNVKEPAAPDVSALRDDFEVIANGDESRNQSSTFIVNGRVSQQNVFSHVYRYRLTPKRSGRLAVPAPATVVDGKTVTGRRLTLSVLEPEEQDLVIPEIQVSRQRVYPTQPFDVTLKILVRPLPDSPQRDPLVPLRRKPPRIDVNWVDLPDGLTGEDKVPWLQKMLSEDGTGFAINDVNLRGGLFFDGPRAAVFNLRRGRESRTGLDGLSIDYHVYELHRQLTPQRAGTYALGPAVVKGSFVAGQDGRNYTGRRLVAIAPAVAVEVREVPAPRPPTFCGGIGGYRLAVAASPTELRVGDPLTVSLTVTRESGSGSLDLISAPDLLAIAELAADFEVVDRNPTGRVQGEAKRFDYALRPKRAGVSLPAIAITVFDPESEEFVDIPARPVSLTVTESARVGGSDLVGAVSGTGGREIRSQGQGIFQNVTDPSKLQNEMINVPALAGVVAGAWCATAGFLGVLALRRRSAGDVAGQRRRNARRAAGKRLLEARELLARGGSPEALRGIRAAVLGLIADSRNLVAEGLTTADAGAVLSQSMVPAEIQSAVQKVLEAIEAAEYGSAETTEVAAVFDQVQQLLPNLARHLERN